MPCLLTPIRLSRSGDGLCCGRSNRQPSRAPTDTYRRSLTVITDLKQHGSVGKRALVRCRARRQLVAMKQPNGGERLAAHLHALPPPPIRLSRSSDGLCCGRSNRQPSRAPTDTYRRSLTAITDLNSTDRWASVPWSAVGTAATGCDEAAERRRTAGRPRLAP